MCVYVLTSLFSMIGDVKHSMPTDSSIFKELCLLHSSQERYTACDHLLDLLLNFHSNFLLNKTASIVI